MYKAERINEDDDKQFHDSIFEKVKYGILKLIIIKKAKEMETKKMTMDLIIPEGCEAKNIQIIDGKICYELVEIKETLAEKVENYRKNEHNSIYMIDLYSEIVNTTSSCTKYMRSRAMPNKQIALEIATLTELIMNCAIANDFEELGIGHGYNIDSDLEVISSRYTKYFRTLQFKTKELAKEFLETYRDKLEIVKKYL